MTTIKHRFKFFLIDYFFKKLKKLDFFKFNFLNFKFNFFSVLKID